MMRRLLMFLSFCALLSTAKSQDIHFSQYYASPLTLNPALTGLHGGDFRAVVNYEVNGLRFRPFRHGLHTPQFRPLLMLVFFLKE